MPPPLAAHELFKQEVKRQFHSLGDFCAHVSISESTYYRMQAGMHVRESTWKRVWGLLGVQDAPPQMGRVSTGLNRAPEPPKDADTPQKEGGDMAGRGGSEAESVLNDLLGPLGDGQKLMRVGCASGVLPKGAWFVLHDEPGPVVAGAVYAVQWRDVLYVRRAVADASGWRYEDAKGQDFPMCRDAPTVLGRVGLVLRVEGV
jgi:hypothetical protein